MLRNRFAVAALSLCGAAAVAGTATNAKADVEDRHVNPFELTLSGSAANSNRFNGFSGSATASIGYYFNENLEVAVRQSVTYNDTSGPVALDGSTRGAVDFHIPLGDRGQIVPFFGVNAGYVYGKGIVNTGEAAPEGGIKFYVNSSTFIYAQVEYEFFFRNGGQFTNGSNFGNGQWIYSLGIGFRF
jgi:hypothetical protein